MDVIGLRMKAFQDMYEVTDNLGETLPLGLCEDLEAELGWGRWWRLQPSAMLQPSCSADV